MDSDEQTYLCILHTGSGERLVERMAREDTITVLTTEADGTRHLRTENLQEHVIQSVNFDQILVEADAALRDNITSMVQLGSGSNNHVSFLGLFIAAF